MVSLAQCPSGLDLQTSAQKWLMNDCLYSACYDDSLEPIAERYIARPRLLFELGGPVATPLPRSMSTLPAYLQLDISACKLQWY